MKTLKLGDIKFDSDTQMRDGLNGDTVADYRDAMKAGVVFPALIVFFDGSEYWLGDGYHRWHAASEAGIGSVKCDVRQGSRRDAILFACSANSVHGLRRTNADKHKAVSTLLKDAEWVTWSDSVIAEKCGVSHPFVGKLREQLVTVTSCQKKRKGKDGKTYKRKATNTPRSSIVIDDEPGCDEPADDCDEPVDCPKEVQQDGGVINRFLPFWNSLSVNDKRIVKIFILDQMGGT